jgi:hypothetical protein
MKLESIPGTVCEARYEGRVSGKPGEIAVVADLICGRCRLYEPLSSEGKVDTVRDRIERDGEECLAFQCVNLSLQEINPADVPEGFFPTVTIVES